MKAQKYFDYKGNEIKNGMTIFVVSTKSPFSKICGYTLNNNEPDYVMEIPSEEFRIISICKTMMKDDIMHVKLKGIDITIIKPLKFVIDGLSEHQIISIKATR